jgi:SAM-dependent methyltransferase
MMDKYTKGYLSYIEETKDIDMSEQYELFMKYVPKGSLILDAGFGSGRDIAFFKQHYEVIGIDISKEFVDYVKTNIHQNVHQMDILNLEFEDEFDAIWACASLVHLNYKELLVSFERFYATLKTKGYLYVSFKTDSINLIINNKNYSIEKFLEDLRGLFGLIEVQKSFSIYKHQHWKSFVLVKLDEGTNSGS